MKKQILFSLIILAAMLVFSACSNNTNEENIDTNPDNETPIEENQENNEPEAEPNNDEVIVDETEGSEDALPSGDNEGNEETRLAGSVVTVAELEGGIAIGDSQEDVNIFFDS